jgi:hypothetical protein
MPRTERSGSRSSVEIMGIGPGGLCSGYVLSKAGVLAAQTLITRGEQNDFEDADAEQEYHAIKRMPRAASR